MPGTGHCQQPAPGPWHTHTHLGCAAVGHHIHPGHEFWELQRRWKDKVGSGCFVTQLVAVGSSHPPNKPCGHSGFQPRCWRLSAALQGVLGAWMEAGIPCKAQGGARPWSSSTWQGKTEPGISWSWGIGSWDWELAPGLGIGTANQHSCCWNWGHHWEWGLAQPSNGKSDQSGELGTPLGTGSQAKHCPGTKTWDRAGNGPITHHWEMGNP